MTPMDHHIDELIMGSTLQVGKQLLILTKFIP